MVGKKIYNLFENFEYKGFWWLPEKPDKKVPGTLTYRSGDRMTLELLGSLQAGSLREIRNDDDPDIILGIADGNRVCTLNGVTHTSSRSIGATDIYRSKYIINRLFEGKHFNSVADIKFSSISINFTSLEEWITHLPYDEDIEANDETQTIKTTASYVYPHAVFEATVPSLHCAINASLEFNDRIGLRVLKWKSTGYIHVVPEAFSSFDWFWDVISDTQNLLTLFMNTPTYPKRIKAFGEEVETSRGRKSRETIHIYFVHSAKEIDKKVHPADMLVILPTVEQQMSSILEAWFSKADQLRPVYSLFFGSMYFRNMYDRFHFLNLIQGVESFHRNLRAGKYIGTSGFRKISKILREAIPEDVTGDFRQSLESRISFGNEYSLRTRIRLLFQELDEKTARLISQNPEEFIDRIVATRNYFTHYTTGLKRKAFDGDALYYAYQKLRILLIILLLKEVGLDESVIRRAVCQNNELTYSLAEGHNVKNFLMTNCKDELPFLPQVDSQSK